MPNSESSGKGESQLQLQQLMAVVQRLQQDRQFSELVEEFTQERNEQVLAFVSRLQQDASFLAVIEEFTGSRPAPPGAKESQGSQETWGWPETEQVLAGKKAAAAAVAAAILVAGG